RVPVPHGPVGKAFDLQVLADLSVEEFVPFSSLLPIAIRFDLIDVDGSLPTAVAGQIALPISIEVQSADSTAAAHWIFPDPGVHNATFPLDVARKADVHR